jgi:hypothetical protein
VPVLVLDGEELRGAKQNRVLNTTVLIAAHSSMAIPVSCVERGRWHDESGLRFSESGHRYSHGVRRAAQMSVDASVRSFAGPSSDQGAVWCAVDELQHARGVESGTSAMRDVFEAYEAELAHISGVFAIQDGQVGLVAMRGGAVLGMDALSRPESYALLHDKLVRSYAIEVASDAPIAHVDGSIARAFLDKLAACTTEEFPAEGLGENLRMSSEGVMGTALTYGGSVLHLAAFAMNGDRPDRDRDGSGFTDGPLRGWRGRRGGVGGSETIY